MYSLIYSKNITMAMPNTPMIMRGRMMLRAIACADRDESELLDCSVGLITVDELVVGDEE